MGAGLDYLAVYFAYGVRYLYPLIMVPFLGRTLGVEGYGVALAGLSLANTVWIFLSFGFPPHGVREIARNLAESNKAQVLSQQFTARLILALPVFLVGAVAVRGSAAFANEFLLGLVGVAIGTLNAFNLGWYYSASNRPKITVVLEVFGLALSATTLLIFVRSPADLPRVFYSLFFVALIQQGLAYLFAMREVKSPIVSTGRSALRLIRESRALFLYSGIPVAVTTASTYFLSIFVAPGAVGAFGVAERATSAVIGLLNPAGQVLIPRVTRLYQTDAVSAKRAAGRMLAAVVFISISVSVLLYWAAPWIIRLLMGDGYDEAARLLRAFVVVIPISSANQFLSSYIIVPTGREEFLAKAATITAGANMIFCFISIPWYGAVAMVLVRVGAEIGLLSTLLYCVLRERLI